MSVVEPLGYSKFYRAYGPSTDPVLCVRTSPSVELVHVWRSETRSKVYQSPSQALEENDKTPFMHIYGTTTNNQVVRRKYQEA